MADLLIRGGLVMTTDGPVHFDVAIGAGTVVELGHSLDLEAPIVVDAGGCWVGPGLVDLHAHLREPGQEWKEDIASGSAAAAAGGYTAVVAMPNTDPPIDSGHLARFVSERGRQAGLVEVTPAGCVTLGRRGAQLSHLDDLWNASVRIFTDDGNCLMDAGLLRQAMEYLAERGGLLAQHAEDAGLSRGGHLHEGSVSSRLGLPGIPTVAEEVIVARDLALVRLTGCRYHIQHASTAGTVALISAAKAEGLPVTAEVTPHHLTFEHQSVAGLDPDFKMYPPLRTPEDRAALRRGLLDGTIDAVATDHAPHALHEREVPFEEAPRGVIGLETAAAAILASTDPDPVTFFARLSVAPARIARLTRQGQWIKKGSPAHLAVIDPITPWIPTSFRSKAGNSPFRGKELRGQVVATVFAGALSHRLSVVGGPS